MTQYLSYIVFLIVPFLALGPGALAQTKESKNTISILAEQTKWKELVDIATPRIEKLSTDEIMLLGKAQSELGQSLIAIKTFQIELSKNPKNLKAKRAIGLEYLKSGKEKDAMSTFREILEADPTYEDVYLDIAKIYDNRNYSQKALESKDITYEQRLLFQDLIAQKSVGRKPQYISKLCELTTLGGHYLKSGGSLEFCPEGIRLRPQEPTNYIFLAMTYRQIGEAEKAHEYFKKAADSFSKSEQAQLALAEYYLDEKKFIQAYPYYVRALKANPKSAKALYGKATTSIEIQKPQEAYEALVLACKFDRQANANVRRATANLRQQKNIEWSKKFDDLIDSCHEK